MCCFSRPTEVSSTQIFARATAPGRQVLVYQMRYAATQPTAMILPLPVATPAKETSVTWKNLKDYAGFFADLQAGFPEKPSSSLFGTKRAAMSVAAAPIEVHEVGDFVASFVPGVDDFSRLDARFSISKDVWAAIPAYADYGFAVFQLKELSGAPHPIAFEWETRLRDSLYFPTVHIHDGTVHANDSFDHVLFFQDAKLDARAGDYDGPASVDPSTKYVRSASKAATFANADRALGALDGDLLVHRTALSGMLPNKDTFVDLASASTRSSLGCGRCELSPSSPRAPLGAGGAALAGLAWIIRRRDALRRA